MTKEGMHFYDLPYHSGAQRWLPIMWDAAETWNSFWHWHHSGKNTYWEGRHTLYTSCPMVVNITVAIDLHCRDFTISYLATDDTGEDVYLSLLSDWDLDAAFFSASNPCLRLKVDLKPFEPGLIALLIAFSSVCHWNALLFGLLIFCLCTYVDLLNSK